MVYYKITYPNHHTKFYASASPLFVKHQIVHSMLVACKQKDAQGIISPDDSNTVCILDGKELCGFSAETSPIAYLISQGEYEEHLANQEQIDVEDETPEIPEEAPEEPILTRAELTRKVAELEELIRTLRAEETH